MSKSKDNAPAKNNAAEVEALLEALRNETDKRAKKKIRAALRKREHWGGLRIVIAKEREANMIASGEHKAKHKAKSTGPKVQAA